MMRQTFHSSSSASGLVYVRQIKLYSVLLLTCSPISQSRNTCFTQPIRRVALWQTAAISDLVYTCTLTPYNHKQMIRLILTSNNRITKESKVWNCRVRYNRIFDWLLPENPLTVSNLLNISLHVVTRTVLKVVNGVQFQSP